MPAGPLEDRGDPTPAWIGSCSFEECSLIVRPHVVLGAYRSQWTGRGGLLAREHAGEAPRAPKLIDVVRDTLRARHYSRRTEKAYIGWATQNQALAALLFLYREVVRVELPWLGDLVRARVRVVSRSSSRATRRAR